MNHRSRTRRAVAVAAALCALSTSGFATPATAAPVTVADPAPRPATQDDKVRAAQAIGIVAGPDLLILTDRNFVFALWQRAKGTEVRASAQLAYSGADSESAQWIKTGIYDANARDQAKITRDDAAAREAREAKERAAMVNHVVVTPELLVQSDKDFCFAMWQRASGPILKAAALAAFDGTAAEQHDFILTGIFTARAADQQAVRDADEQASAEQKAAQAARDARSRAAAVVAIEPTAGQYVEPDVNFVMDLWEAAKPNSEVKAAAEHALRTMDPAELTAYIGGGIQQANLRDWLAWNKKQGQTNRRLLFELRTRSVQSGVHPALVTAADVAAAGSDDDVSRFLRLGQYEDTVLTQSFQTLSPGAKGAYLRGVTDAVVGTGATGADATWRIVPGKADTKCHSLESVTHPEYYLRQLGQRVVIGASDGTDQFLADATWCSKAGVSGTGVTLESYSLRGRFLRKFATQVWAADSSGLHPYDTATGYATDVSWQTDGPNPVTP